MSTAPARTGAGRTQGGPLGGSSSAGRSRRGNLPAEMSRFVGRRQEISQVKGLLSNWRLVTLTGAGGMGKTRLALRVAEQVRRTFNDGVWLVDLTAVRGLESAALEEDEYGPLKQRALRRLAAAVAEVLGIGDWSTAPPLEVLTDYLSSRRLLLVLDNCEHLVEPAAVLVNALLRECADLRILATSREPLYVAAEALFSVPPLPTPAVDQSVPLAQLAGYEAVELFLARAEAALPSFRLTEANQDAIAGICQRVDGHPLAIELAAARLRVLSPEQIMTRLTDRFALLRRRMHDGPDRQQTLRACVEWSFDLCSKQEQRLWARISVFAGGCDIDTVEGVCADELPGEDLAVSELLDLVADLVDKSILIREEHRDVVRYRMLETIRDYGQEQLASAGEWEMVRRRHRDWFQQLVTRAEADLISPRQAAWMVRLDRELPDIRAALEYCLTEPGESTVAMEMATALDTLWWRGRPNEGRRWCERALAAQDGTPTPMWFRAQYEVVKLAVFQGDVGPAMVEATRLGEWAGQLGDWRLQAWAGTMTLGIQVYAGFPAHAAAEADALLVAQRAIGDLPKLMDGLLAMSFGYWAVGNWEKAAACHEEILAITTPQGETWYRSMSMLHLGIVRWRQGQVEEAAALVRGSLRLRVGIDDLRSSLQCLAALAWIAGARGDHRRAAILLGAAQALAREVNTPVSALPGLLAFHEECTRDARRALGDQGFRTAFEQGSTWSNDEVIAYALDEVAPPTAEPPAPSSPEVAALTRRERQVAALVAEGLSNKEIAAKLVIAARTAESHVDHILTKLSLGNRAQIASWVTAQRQLGGDV